jgi:hypothetical protein
VPKRYTCEFLKPMSDIGNRLLGPFHPKPLEIACHRIGKLQSAICHIGSIHDTHQSNHHVRQIDHAPVLCTAWAVCRRSHTAQRVRQPWASSFRFIGWCINMIHVSLYRISRGRNTSKAEEFCRDARIADNCRPRSLGSPFDSPIAIYHGRILLKSEEDHAIRSSSHNRGT